MCSSSHFQNHYYSSCHHYGKSINEIILSGRQLLCLLIDTKVWFLCAFALAQGQFLRCCEHIVLLELIRPIRHGLVKLPPQGLILSSWQGRAHAIFIPEGALSWDPRYFSISQSTINHSHPALKFVLPNQCRDLLSTVQSQLRICP